MQNWVHASLALLAAGSVTTLALAALILSADLTLTNTDVWRIIEQTADDKGEPADLNCDGVVDGADLGILLANRG